MINLLTRWWNFSLVVRQQQEVVGFTIGDHPEKRKGERWLPVDGLAERVAFLATVRAAIGALPPEFLLRVIRVGLAAEYVGVVDGNPGAWLATRFGGRETPPKLPNNILAVRSHVSQEFVEAFDRRYVWNDQERVGNWFGPDGVLLRECAVVFSTDIKTAVEENSAPPWVTGVITGPPLASTEIGSFFSDGTSGALDLLIARVRTHLPEGATFNE